VDDALVFMVMDRVYAEPLANRSNGFAVSGPVHAGAVLEEIRKLQAVDIPGDWVSAYHRGQKILAYLEVIHSHLPARMIRVLGSIGTQWDSGRGVVLSHGDLIPPNIMVRDGCYWFVDWEWAGLRPPSYDPALFLLFSRRPDEVLGLFDKTGGPWDTEELYKDCVVIAAREIKN
jgi:thiamine kinase-like enzyme